MSVVFDAGAFVAAERGDRELMAIVKRERLAGRSPLSHGGVIGQVWRSGTGRQVPLVRLLAGVDVRPLDDATGRRVGSLLARSATSDVIDAAVVLLAVDGDEIYTSDVEDLATLARATGVQVDIIAV